MPRIYFFFAVLLTLHGCGVLPSQHHTPKREFRGVWVASVANIDWPKSGWNGSAVQKADFTKILDFYHGLNFNAVIVQVRAAGDALYPSENAPWSRYISGREGRYAQWDEDPLAWMIKETHQRGMEFHAWFNPYRATVSLKTENLSPDHDFYQHPEWMLTYGNKNYYNPGLPEVRAKFNAVIAEVVSNYNIDAIHFDDYFYPYKIEGQQLQDSTIYKKYASPGQSLEDWRRSNVDSLVKGVHTTIKNIKPWVLFGISPFGVWKNKATDPRGSDTQAGQTTYDDLYADPLLWMKEGWIDYLAPQVYWSMDLPVASHKKIVDWWSKNTTGTTLYIGNGAYKIRNNSDAAWDKKTELPNQIALARTTSKVSGNIFFSAKSLMQENQDVVRYLKRKYYRFPALTPVQNIVNNKVPTPPKLLAITKNRDSIFIKIALQEPLKQALIYQSGRQKKESYPIRKLTAKLGISPNSETIAFPKSILHRKNFALVFLDRYGNEAKPIILNVKKINQHD